LSIVGRRVIRSPIVMEMLRQQQVKSNMMMCTLAGSARTYQPTPLEKKFLVWTGKYQTVEEVPNLINQEVMDKARNRIRIRLANIMMVLTAIGCVLMIFSGKKAAERGETVSKMNTEWHEEYNRKAAEEANGKH
jgi:beta-lactamase regulating signal transducer with metallopeptidase domain